MQSMKQVALLVAFLAEAEVASLAETAVAVVIGIASEVGPLAAALK